MDGLAGEKVKTGMPKTGHTQVDLPRAGDEIQWTKLRRDLEPDV